MRLKKARTTAGLTQAQLAARVRCNQKQISNLEAGAVPNPSYRLVVKICRVLGVDPECVAEFRVGGKS